MSVNLTDKNATLASLDNLGSLETGAMLSTLESSHRMILARKGRQKAASGKSFKELQSDLMAALESEADNLPPLTRAAFEALSEKGAASVGLEYHYLETWRDAARAVLYMRGVTVSLKGDGTASVKRV